MYLIYSILYLVVLFFILPFEYLKRSKDLRKRWIRERFGLLPYLYPKKSQIFLGPSSAYKTVWVHAVSVGEVIAAVALIKKIKDRHPSFEIIVSTVTDTGQKVASEKIGGIARIIYMPFDLPFAIKNAVERIRPSVFIIIETELWPNTIRILNRIGVPVLLMNGRISDKSFNGYRKLRFFIKDVLNRMTLLCMQNELYSERVRAMGADPEKIRSIGNFKFDTRPPSEVPEWTGILKSQESRVKSQEFTIIAGSTHRTEEDLILDVYIKLREDFPKLNLIIAPRHPERFKEVEELIKKRGIEYIKRSEVRKRGSAEVTLRNSFRTSALPHFSSSGLIILLDVIGELASVYGVCDIAVMGGSFIQHGGQNPLEPAYWGKAIVCGPHMENFPFIDEFYKNGGAIRVEAISTNTFAFPLYQSIKELLSCQEKMVSMGKIAKELYAKNSGATERAMEIMERYLKGSDESAVPRDKLKSNNNSKDLLLVTRYSLLEKAYYIGYSIKKQHSLKHQKRLQHKVISIGNITVGGTGKTPATIAVAEEAKRRGLQPVILTRGYKGEEKGPCFVDMSVLRQQALGNIHQAWSVKRSSLDHRLSTLDASRLYGDESVLMAERLKDVPIVKCADRYEGAIFAINKLNLQPVFILDDGFQHWRLHRDIDIVLIDGLNPFGNRRLLPLGPLREPLLELERADIFVITKKRNEELLYELKAINPSAPVFFSEYKIVKVRDTNGNELPVEVLKNKKVYAFCGIANPESFKQTVLSLCGELSGFKAYCDHHRYSEKDVLYLQNQCNALNCDSLLTTEKDMVKIRELVAMGKSAPLYETRVPQKVKDTVTPKSLRLFGDPFLGTPVRLGWQEAKRALDNILCLEIEFCVDSSFFDEVFKNIP